MQQFNCNPHDISGKVFALGKVSIGEPGASTTSNPTVGLIEAN
jgi:hypothetical protein